MSFEEFEDGHHGISELNDFSKSESLCHCDASHQVSAQSDLWFGRCCLKNFKMAAMAKISRNGGHLGYQNGTILAILNLCLTVMHRLENFKMATILDICTKRF